MKTFLLIDTSSKEVKSVFRSTDLDTARLRMADQVFGWQPGDGGTLGSLFKQHKTDVVELDGKWAEKMQPKMVIGIDEVGLGAWAGPLVVCAFAAPDESWTINGLDDSKKLSKIARDKFGKLLMKEYSDDYVLVQVEAGDIDQHGIGKVLPLAMERALERLMQKVGTPNRVIIDGEDKGIRGAEYHPKADGEFPSVMAASIIAKVYRDGLMHQHAVDYPQYGFESHVGYGVPKHSAALREHGVCPLHRRSYEPIKSLISGE